MLTAMGVELFIVAPDAADDSPKRALQSAGLTYLERAIPATRDAFGAEDPEVALAETDYIDATLELDRTNPPPDVDAYARKAYRIRLARLGPGNGETIAAMMELARIDGLPSRTGGTPDKVKAAAALMEQARALQAAGPPRARMDTIWPLIHEADIYLENGLPSEAESAFERAENQFKTADRKDDGDILGFAILSLDFAERMNDRDPARAKRIQDRYSGTLAALIAKVGASPRQ
jgi:hypothetical protein